MRLLDLTKNKFPKSRKKVFRRMAIELAKFLPFPFFGALISPLITGDFFTDQWAWSVLFALATSILLAPLYCLRLVRILRETLNEELLCHTRLALNFSVAMPEAIIFHTDKPNEGSEVRSDEDRSYFLRETISQRPKQNWDTATLNGMLWDIDELAECVASEVHASLKAIRPDVSDLKTRAESGDVDAQYDLGLRYWDVNTHDLVEAYFWFRLAASHGHEGARQARRDLERLMSKELILQAKHRAAKWMTSYPLKNHEQ